MTTNADIPAPKPPGPWVDEERCVCGATYRDHRAYPSFTAAAVMVRAANGGFDEGGGYRSRGPILWAMRVIKLQDWYQAHFGCGVPERANRCDLCLPRCPWCVPPDDNPPG